MGSFDAGKAPIANFEGQTSPYYPPDANGATGPNHFMQTLNTTYSIYNKTGTRLVGPTNLNLLFGTVPGATCNDGDPIVLYDEQADRWMVAEFSICSTNDRMLVAVSQTNDPTGSWHCYSFDVADMPDYEKFGIWRDGYYMATNNSSGKDIYVFERSKMLIGATAQMVGFDNPWRPSTIDGFVCVPPVDNDGAFAPAGSPGLFVAFNDDAIGGGSDQLWIYELAVNWTTPTSSTFGRVQQIPVASFDSNFGNNWDNIKQPGTTRELDAIPMVVMNAPQYRNFGTHQTMVLCHIVDVDNTDHAGIRWYELRKSGTSWTVRQHGTYAPDIHSRWMASISLSGYNTIGLGYSISSSTLYPGIRYTGQSATAYNNASGILDVTEQVITTGTNSQTAYNRWGDYSSICLDPTDDFTFWYTNQYIASNSSRKTRIASFQIGSMPTFPDLTVLIPSANPSTVSAGRTTTASCTILNQGTASATASVLKYYLSSDNIYSAGDLLLGQDNVTSLNITQTLALSENFVIPSATTPGTWFILFYADANLQVAESNENNNVSFFQITVTPEILLPDLTILNPASNPANIEAGQTSLASCFVKNLGPGNAPVSVLKYYLSSDIIINSGDLLLGSDTVTYLAVAESAALNEVVTIPLLTGPGNWYILFMADANSQIQESNETNNLGFTQIVVTNNGWIVCPEAISVCISADPLTLSGGMPAGGTYSGTGVTDGIFYPLTADPGNHQINYCYTSAQQQVLCCDFTISVTGTIYELPDGWSGLSSFIIPDNPLINSIFDEIGENLSILYNFDGVYWPGGNVNTLTNWDSSSGYIIKVNGNNDIAFCGIENSEKTVILETGWNLMPVLSPGNFILTDLFDDLNKLEVVKEIAGNGVFWSDFQINTLGTIGAGKAYLVLMNAPGIVTFPAASSKIPISDKTRKNPVLSPWNEVVASPSSHIIAFNGNENPFEKGDIVGGFTTEGICAGFTTIDDPEMAFSLCLYGKDQHSSESAGFEPDEKISYILFRPQTGEIFDLQVKYHANFKKEVFEINGLSAIISAEMLQLSTVDLTIEPLFIYPNPSNGVFNIGGISGKMNIEICDPQGAIYEKRDIILPGKLDLSNLVPSLYFIRFCSADGAFLRRVLIK
jgi:hypothetical protein